ncbi:MAG: FAD-binding oxidoreductase [Fibrobacteres bacterium]|nr:FAD-binding oxidoreductase [Fibrobacterota bacterium]
MTSEIDELANQLAGFFQARERLQTLYSREELTDLTVPFIFLDSITGEPEIDAANGFLSFLCGTKVSAISAILKGTPFLSEPFISLDQNVSIGKYFTNDNVFTSDSLAALTVIMPDGTVMTFGKKAFASVAGYRAIELFLGTKNLLGIPVKFVYKLQPDDLPLEIQKSLYSPSKPVTEFTGEDRKIILRMKSVYDPYHILNTFYL